MEVSSCANLTLFDIVIQTDQILILVPGIVEWPQYRGEPQNFVFRKDKSYVEKDIDRVEGIAFINTIVR